MQKLVVIYIIFCKCFANGAENIITSYNGQISDKLPGWTFKASTSHKNGMTFNKFEGYYPDKGGKLISPKIDLPGNFGKGGYYKISFEAKAAERAYQGIDFFDKDGESLPDFYDVVYPGKKRKYQRVFYAMDCISSIKMFFQSRNGIEVWNIKLEKATVEEAAEYCENLYSSMPELDFSAPVNSMKLLPKTSQALTNGKPWRVVMLGDSIMQDTYNSQFHSLLKRHFPRSNFKYTISVRGSTGCWYYCQDKYFNEYIKDKKPDLLIIGGISNYEERYNPSGSKAIEMVVKKAKKQLGCEVLVLSTTLSYDTRKHDINDLKKNISACEWNINEDIFILDSYDLKGLPEVCERNNVPLWDLATPTYKWLYRSGKPHGFYNRDRVHSGEIGKQIIGRSLLEYFLTAK